MTNQPGIMPDDLEILGSTLNNGITNPPTNQSPTVQGQENNNLDKEKNKNIEAEKLAAEQAAAEKAKAEEAAKAANSKKEENKKEEDGELPLILSIAEKFNYQYTDEELAKLQDSDEELHTLVDKVAEKRAIELYEKKLSEQEDLRDLIEYVRAGGSVASYTEALNKSEYFQNLKFDENDSRLQKEAVAEFYRLTSNLSEEDIQTEIKDLEDAGILAIKSKRYFEQVQGHYKQHRSQIVEQQKAERKAQEEQAAKAYEETVKLIRNSEKVHTLPLPAAEKEELIKFITPDKSGRSQYDQAVENFTTNDYIALALLVKRGFDLSGLVENTVKTKTAESLVERFKRIKVTSGSQKQNTGYGNAVDDVTKEGIRLQ